MTGLADHDGHGGERGVDPIHAINLRAWETNRLRAAQLVEIVSGLRDIGQLSTEERDRATSLTHQLIGSAGTFGHEAVTELARRIEVLLAVLPALVPAGITELDDLTRGVCDELREKPSQDS